MTEGCCHPGQWGWQRRLVVLGVRGKELLGWVEVGSCSQHSQCCENPWGGSRVGARLIEEINEVVGPASVPGCDVLPPRQQTKPPLLR